VWWILAPQKTYLVVRVHMLLLLLLQGDPAENIPKLVQETGAGLLVNDYSPLKLGRKWKDKVGHGRVRWGTGGGGGVVRSVRCVQVCASDWHGAIGKQL
jgi:hypothetical protein